jgi:hypothetical protein
MPKRAATKKEVKEVGLGTPFQHELLSRSRDKVRIERHLETEQKIFLLAKQSEKNGKLDQSLRQASVATLKQVIYAKQTLRLQPEPYQPLKFDHRSDSEVDPDSEACSQQTEENTSEPFTFREFICGLLKFSYLEFILGLIIGFAIGFDTLSIFSHRE